MDLPARKAMIAAYKERNPAYGVFEVICTATGQAWVGQSRHLDTQQNSLWFGLRHVGSPQPISTPNGGCERLLPALKSITGFDPQHVLRMSAPGQDGGPDLKGEFRAGRCRQKSTLIADIRRVRFREQRSLYFSQ